MATLPDAPISNDDVITIAERFNAQQNKSDISEILKELFSVEKLYFITDIKSDEIKLITRIKSIASIKGFESWNECIDLYLKLKISKDRKSRQEIIEAIKGYYGMGMMKRGLFGFGKPKEM
ncbi:MAG TPA: hypothetical protein VJ201_02640 [Candidatus Babeliales bacterium]|nr:hypothetical protein [Candidatus Babeliales bacterium]